MLRFLLALPLVLAACADAPVGSKERPFTMYFVPSVDAETIATNADDLTAFVAKEVSQELYGNDDGFHIKSAIPTSYIAVVEAFSTGRADFAALNTFSYVLAKDVKNYPIEAILTVVRGKDETHYKGQFLAAADSGIEKIQDLEGKKFAYVDVASTAGYLLPSATLKEAGITLGETVLAHKHDNVVMMIYQGQVDAGATYYSPPKVETGPDGTTHEVPRDARARVATQYPDVYEKVRIIGFTDDTPNDAWVLRTNLEVSGVSQEQVKAAVSKALLKFAATDQGKAALESLYNISGLAPADDARYESIRKLVRESDLNLETAVK
ncbi:MAG: phosphate/phosphite/phosphonate ABC transporter substrate-binding protein [Planctomycetota bacterium]